MAHITRQVTRSIVLFSIFSHFIAVGCGGPKAIEGGLIHFTVQPQSTESETLASAYKALTTGEFEVFTTPTATSDFSCYLVNVAGPGIPIFNTLPDCPLNASYTGAGIGLRSEPVPTGTTVTLQVPEGSDRQVSVFGIYPPVSECTGTNSSSGPPQQTTGYVLGNTTVELKDDISVTVPISFTAGSSPAFTCQSEQIIQPSVGTYNSTCANTISLPVSPAPIAGSGGGGTTITNFASNVLTEDSVYAVSECNTSAINQSVYSEYQFDVSGYDLSNFELVRLYWRGQIGEYGATCSNSPITTAGGGIYLYNAVTTGWDTLQASFSASGASTEVIYISRNNISQYLVGGTHFVVRLVSIQSGGAMRCGRVATDYIRLVLSKPHS